MTNPIRTICLAAWLALTGCAGEPEQPLPAKPDARAAQPSAPVEPRDEVERLLARAARQDASQASGLRLEAAARLVERGEMARAREVLATVDTNRVAPQQQARASLLDARIALATGDVSHAMSALTDPQAPWLQGGLPRALQVELATTRADVLLAAHRPLDAAAARAEVQPWLNDDPARRANAEATLTALARVPLGELERAAASATSEDWRGWLRLSAIIRDMRPTPGQQLERVQQWQIDYAAISALDTAANQVVPEFRRRIAQPARVALLLPLSGRAAPSGQAVLQGFAAVYYGQLADATSPPAVAVIDTNSADGGFTGAYRRATADGATLVVGPLLKEELAAFTDGSLQATVPTIALNFLDAPGQPLPKVYQFGIDFTDEIEQLVARARDEGRTNAVALADSGPRSRRQVDEFAQRWRASGGELLGTLYLEDLNDYREALERTLLLEQSAARAAALTRLLGVPLQAEPRRRADLDLFVLLAEPVPARSIRSLLPFLFAGDIPTWGSSLSHGGGSTPEEDLDLEGLRFADMPWFAAAESALRQTARGAVPAGGMERLVALGADAARLQARAGLLDWAAGDGLGGASGELHVADGRIHRRSDWYVFRQGLAEAEVVRATADTPEPGLRSSTEGDLPWSAPENQAAPPADVQPRTLP
jgi:outer membrane PBP1 activator LpoA protein